MTYVAVKGGERAILNAERLLRAKRRGESREPELGVHQIEQQLRLAVDRVMCEAGLFDRELAALAIKQAWGDLVEAAFLLRAYRTTLPRFADSLPIDTSAMDLARRISAIFKDVPGGQIIGPTFDYTQRLLDFSLLAENGAYAVPETTSTDEAIPPVLDTLGAEGLIAPEPPGDDEPGGDITRTPLQFPAERSVRLQTLARADEGFVLGLAYSTQRGYGSTHPFAGEVRVGSLEITIVPDEVGFDIPIGEIDVTEVQMVNQFAGNAEQAPQFTRGYGLTLGNNERKALSMAIVDRALRAKELGETVKGPAQDEEFVLMHGDGVEAQGFVQHLKLPHYVDFQSELEMVRHMRAAE